MRTFDASNWEPRELIAPDGRRFTPSSRAEEGELLARKYRMADPEQGQDVPQTAQVPVADAAPESAPVAESVVEDVPADLESEPAEQAPQRPRRPRKPAAAPVAETAAEPITEAAPVADTQEEQL
ncbi:hypothetical protein [Rhodococcus sp. p52]|uniref:hypothetical protein n=1 Tax=Rhodococcus sp. p52 TaxID=935199 RepID=UPI0012F4897F|nr:hypothetical protein [Rhodococcus sp. p52]